MIAFLDESGVPSLKSIDPYFPVFTLAALFINERHYEKFIVPYARRIKAVFWKPLGADTVIFHSHPMRKKQGDFSILLHQYTRNRFLGCLTSLMQKGHYHLICSSIDKHKHKAQYVYPVDPYELSMKFILERTIPLCKNHGLKQICFFAEKRGKREDDQLKVAFYDVTSNGTEYISRQEFRQIDFSLKMVSKERNVIGSQLADLAAYPISKYVLNPSAANPPFDVLKTKFYLGLQYGLKIFPG